MSTKINVFFCCCYSCNPKYLTLLAIGQFHREHGHTQIHQKLGKIFLAYKKPNPRSDDDFKNEVIVMVICGGAQVSCTCTPPFLIVYLGEHLISGFV